jgi:outer membrane protein OmpA-like peptidoglycan-associated protein
MKSITLRLPTTFLFAGIWMLFSMSTTSCKAQKREDSPNKFEKKGLEFLQKGETQKAIETFEKGLAANPGHKDLLNMLGALYKDAGQYELAAQRLKTLTIYHYNYTNGYYFLAEMQFKIMQFKECILSIDTFLMKKPERKDLVKEAEMLQKRAKFSVKAIENPVDVTFINMGKGINSKNHEYWPAMTIDGQTFIFTRQQSNREDVYLSKKMGGEWGKAYPLPGEVNSDRNEGTASITADGKYIFFTMCNRPGGYGSCDLYLSILQPDGTFSKPRHLQPPLNTAAWESQPSISHDGLTLYFSSGREGGYGGLDLWKAEWKGTHFGEPINLGPEVNTPGNEESPFIHPDGVTLYFSSGGRENCIGGKDVYITRLQDNQQWSTPENLGYPINTSGDDFGFIVDRLGQFAYMASDRVGGMGGMDIYQLELPGNIKPEPVSYVNGFVFDKNTKAPIAATVELIDLETGETFRKITSDKLKGEFMVVLKKDKRYMVNIDEEHYLFYSDNFTLDEGSMEKPFVIQAPLSKPDSGAIMVLNNIFFDVDKFILKPESKNELNKLLQFLHKFPRMSIEIGGHTDNTGFKDRNVKLSENRAKAVLEHLVAHGISRHRMTYKGYADDIPIADNNTPEGRSQNRRTEIKIISVE